MQVQILDQYKDHKDRVFVAMVYPEGEETFLGIFWMKPTHFQHSLPNFVPVVVPMNNLDEDNNEVFQSILKKVISGSLTILPIELELFDMRSVASSWMVNTLNVVSE